MGLQMDTMSTWRLWEYWDLSFSVKLLNGKYFLYWTISLAQEPFFWLLANYIIPNGIVFNKRQRPLSFEKKKRKKILPVGSCTWTLGAQFVALFEETLEHLGSAALLEEVLTLVGLCGFVAPSYLSLPVFFQCVVKLQPLGFLLSLPAAMPSWPWWTLSVIVNQNNCFFYSKSLLVMEFYGSIK